jgi:hypothetical protein
MSNIAEGYVWSRVVLCGLPVRLQWNAAEHNRVQNVADNRL